MNPDDDDTPIPLQRCWRCNYKIDSTSSATGRDKPKAGDVSMCLACGAVAIFTDDMQLREPTVTELAEVSGNPVLIKAQIYRAGIVGDKLRGKYKL